MSYNAIISGFDELRQTVTNNGGGKYHLKPNMEEYEKFIGDRKDEFRKLLRSEGFYFHMTLPQGLEEVQEEAFRDCHRLQSVMFPENLQTIGRAAFFNCIELMKLTLKNGLKEIGHHAFDGCTSLIFVTFPEGLQKIGHHAFAKCIYLHSVKLKNGLRKIGENAFDGCTRLRTLTLPKGLEQVEARAFANCTALTSVTLPKGLKGIGHHAFENCERLESVTLLGGRLTIYGDAVFAGCVRLRIIFVSEDLLPLFRVNKEKFGIAPKVIIRRPPRRSDRLAKKPRLRF